MRRIVAHAENSVQLRRVHYPYDIPDLPATPPDLRDSVPFTEEIWAIAQSLDCICEFSRTFEVLARLEGQLHGTARRDHSPSLALNFDPGHSLRSVNQ